MNGTTNLTAATEKVLNGRGYPHYRPLVLFHKPAVDTVVVDGKALSLCLVRPVVADQGPVPAVSIVGLHRGAVDPDHIPEVGPAVGGVCGEYLSGQRRVKNTLNPKAKV